MSEIVLLGMNHKTADVELRECIAFTPPEAEQALETLQDHQGVREIIIVSTCNRVEILIHAEEGAEAVETAKNRISEWKNLPVSRFSNALYVYKNDDAVRHVFRVAASLDSMMLGEPQILGQIKDAYRTAVKKKTSGVILNRLMHKTFSVAKKIRTETGIGGHAVSISYAATELAQKIFGSLDDRKVLLVGAGEMAELAVEHLIRKRIGDIFVANRTFERGLNLAERFRGRAVRFEEIPDCLQTVDIVISSTGSPDYVVRKKDVKPIMKKRKNRSVFFIDIAVPRDIDPEINRLHNAYVYDIDDLKNVIEENISDRKKEAAKAERIVDEAVVNFNKWRDSIAAVPTIVAIRRKMESIADSEIRKTAGAMHASEKDREALVKMTRAMINKILHEPTLFLKKNGYRGDKTLYIDVTRKLFHLDEDMEAH